MGVVLRGSCPCGAPHTATHAALHGSCPLAHSTHGHAAALAPTHLGGEQEHGDGAARVLEAPDLCLPALRARNAAVDAAVLQAAALNALLRTTV